MIGPTGEEAPADEAVRGERRFVQDEILRTAETILLNATGTMPMLEDTLDKLAVDYGKGARYAGLVKVVGEQLGIVYHLRNNDGKLTSGPSFRLDTQAVPEVFVVGEMGDKVSDTETRGFTIDFDPQADAIAVTNVGETPILITGDVLNGPSN